MQLNHSVITALHMSLFSAACWKLELQRALSLLQANNLTPGIRMHVFWLNNVAYKYEI